MAAKTYYVANGAMPTTAPITKQATGTSTRTMLQLAPATGVIIRPIAYGCSFDGSAAATPGYIELIETNVAGSAMTAFAVADVMPFGDANAPANTSGSSGVPLNLGTALSCYSAGSSTEGSTTTTRVFDTQLIAPTNQYVIQLPLGREPEVVPGRFLRIRATFGTSVNLLCWIVFEI